MLYWCPHFTVFSRHTFVRVIWPREQFNGRVTDASDTHRRFGFCCILVACFRPTIAPFWMWRMHVMEETFMDIVVLSWFTPIKNLTLHCLCTSCLKILQPDDFANDVCGLAAVFAHVFFLSYREVFLSFVRIASEDGVGTCNHEILVFPRSLHSNW